MSEEVRIIRPPSYVALILYKFISGLLEVIIGVAFGVFDQQFVRIYNNFQLAHLREDPGLFSRAIEHTVPYLLDHHTYVIVFFLSIGLGKIAGAIGLWYEKMWAIYLMIILSTLSLPFELVDLVRAPTVFKLFYLVVNVAIISYLSWFNPHIQHMMRKHHEKKSEKEADRS